jgi:hypothetical protein
MSKDEIDTMWQQAMQESIKEGEMYTRYHFAKLVAEAEREACAKVCYEAKANIWEFHPYEVREAANSVCVNLAATIRARGQA